MQEKFNVFAQNLAYYNEGYIVGDWIKLPQSPEIIDNFLKEIVKVDDEHEEYEIADVDGVPFPYESIQWSDLKDLNNLAIIYQNLDDYEKESIASYLELVGEEHYAICELINICLQVDHIEYCRYSFEGLEYSQNYSPELKIGYTMAEEYGIYDQLKNLRIIDKGYLVSDFDLDLQLYSKNEIQKKVYEILEKSNELERREKCIEEVSL